MARAATDTANSAIPERPSNIMYCWGEGGREGIGRVGGREGGGRGREGGKNIAK